MLKFNGTLNSNIVIKQNLIKQPEFRMLIYTVQFKRDRIIYLKEALKKRIVSILRQAWAAK